MKPADENKPEFDKSARDYEALFKPWLKIAGASREYFGRSRLDCLSYLLHEQEIAARRVVDFGCGTGMSLSLLSDILDAEQVIGLDTSEESLAVARESVGSRPVELAIPTQICSQTRSRLGFLQWCVPSHTVGGAARGGGLYLSLLAARRYVRTVGKQLLESYSCFGHQAFGDR
jgi:SAM-dependent methyltransferase